MKLTKIALQKIHKPEIRMKIALVLGITDQQIARYIKNNSDNLTKAAALKVIREETGLKDDQILETELATATS